MGPHQRSLSGSISVLVAAATLAGAPAAPAQAIVAQTSGLSNPGFVVDFGANLFPNFTPVSTEFPPLTVTHSRYFTTGVSTNLVGGFLTNDFNVGPPDTMTMRFAVLVTDASFVYHQIGTQSPSTIRFLMQGTLVTSFSGLWNQAQTNNYFGLTNALFDEIQIDFVGDFNVDTVAFNPVVPIVAQCVLANGSGINPLDFACGTVPVLGSTWQGQIVTNANTVATVVAFAASLGTPLPIFGGELLINPTGAFLSFSPGGNHSLAIPAASRWIGASLVGQGARLQSIGGVLSVVPLNARVLYLGL